MTTFTVPVDVATTLAQRCLQYIGIEPEIDPGDRGTLIFRADLTPEQSATVQTIIDTATPLDPASYAALRSEMQTLRALRQMGRNAFMDLTAAERDRAMYDAFTSVTKVLLAILRDE